MKFSTRFTSILLAALLMLSLVLVSCDKGETPDGGEQQGTTTTIADASTTTPAEGEASAEAEDLVLIKDGVSYVTVVRDDDADSKAPRALNASEVFNAIKDATGVAPKINTDWIRDGQEHDSESVEILVGVTNYKESAEVLSELTYGSYTIKVVGKKLVVAAFSDAVLEVAVYKLISYIDSCATEGNLVIPADYCETGVDSRMLNTVPMYDGGDFNCAYLGGADSNLLLIDNTNADEYSAYLKKLESAGWVQYTTNTIGSNSFATYNNDEYTLNVGYYDYEDATRIVVEPKAPAVALASENKYEKVTTTQITMLGVEYISKSTGEPISNGQSMLIRLEDGRFIVIDGGFNDNAGSKSGVLLVDALREQSKDYLKPDEKITIAAWIITHAHGDHYGMIVEQYGRFQSMNVESFIVNFMSEEERAAAISSTKYGDNWGSSEGSGWPKLLNAAKALGSVVYNVRVGQVFYVADLQMDILYTIDSFAPKICNALNTCSLVIKMTFNSGDTFLMTGDATGNGLEICAQMYGDYLQCDILQMAHHGGGTWGNDTGTATAYRLVDPTVVLYPRGMATYASASAKTYNKVVLSEELGGTNPNYKETFVSGAEGEQIIIPIPYTVGSAIEIKNP